MLECCIRPGALLAGGGDAVDSKDMNTANTLPVRGKSQSGEAPDKHLMLSPLPLPGDFLPILRFFLGNLFRCISLFQPLCSYDWMKEGFLFKCLSMIIFVLRFISSVLDTEVSDCGLRSNVFPVVTRRHWGFESPCLGFSLKRLGALTQSIIAFLV